MVTTIIQEHTCPRCGNLRTVRLSHSNASFCFNCHWQWDAAETASEPAHVQSLSRAQLARLESYRAAVRNGFYSDGEV